MHIYIVKIPTKRYNDGTVQNYRIAIYDEQSTFRGVRGSFETLTEALWYADGAAKMANILKGGPVSEISHVDESDFLPRESGRFRSNTR